MSCLTEWPRAFTSAVLTVDGSASGIPALAYSFAETWNRVRLIPSGPINRCLKYVWQDSYFGEGVVDRYAEFRPYFVSTIDACNPTAPSVTGAASQALEPSDIEGNLPYPLTDPPIVGTLGSDPVYGMVVDFTITPSWNSETRSALRNFPEAEEDAPVQDIHIDDVPDTPDAHREQTVTAGDADTDRVMNGGVQLEWVEPERASGGGRTLLFAFGFVFGSPSTGLVSATPAYPAWIAPTAYFVGDVVTYLGSRYECLIGNQLIGAEQSNPANTPDNRDDRWKIFNPFDHILVTLVRKGLRFDFAGRYAGLSITAITLVADSGEVKGYSVSVPDSRVSVNYRLWLKLTDPTRFSMIEDVTIEGPVTITDPGDGDFAMTKTVGLNTATFHFE